MGVDVVSQKHRKKTDKNNSDLLKNIATNIIGITAICYLFGFIIVKTYLANFHINTLELIAPRYVSTGLLFLLITLYHFLLSYLIYRIFHEQADGLLSFLLIFPNKIHNLWRKKAEEKNIENLQGENNSTFIPQNWKNKFHIFLEKNNLYLFYLLLLIIITPDFLDFLTQNLYSYAIKHFTFDIIQLSLWMICVGFLIFWYFSPYQKRQSKGILIAFMTLILMNVYKITITYSNVFFPLVDQGIGGGKATQVRLFFKNKEELKFLNKNGDRVNFIPEPFHKQSSFRVKSGISVPVCLLEQTEKSYFVAYLVGIQNNNVVSTLPAKNCIVSAIPAFSIDDGELQEHQYSWVIKQINRDVVTGTYYILGNDDNNVLDIGGQK